MINIINQAIITAAGIGTRFAPISKFIPKEMLPLYDKPIIDYIINEILQSDINNILCIVNPNKNMIIDYCKFINRDKKNLNMQYIYQYEQSGLGHAILQAKDYIKNNMFVVALGDDIVTDGGLLIKDMIKYVYQMSSLSSIISLDKVPYDQMSSYGCVAVEQTEFDNIFRIKHIIEKPDKNTILKYNLQYIVTGRYILTSTIFDILSNTQFGYNDELQLTDALNTLLDGESLYGYVNTRYKRYDMGTKDRYLKSTLAYMCEVNKDNNLIKWIKEYIQN